MAAFDIYQVITDRIIAELEKGVVPWKKPWVGNRYAIKHINGKPYSMLNQMLLGEPGEYVTFKQCHQEGGRIKKGEKARMVVFWKWLEQKDEETGEVKEIPFLRYYNVFHINQCEGIKPKHTEELPTDPATADEKAEEIITDYIARSGVVLVHENGDRAFYRPATDTVTLPRMEQFASSAEYYGTAFHELIHSTGHKDRLDRVRTVAAFGREEYSKEELVAEIGSAALVNRVGLECQSSFQNSAAYIASWLKALKGDKRMIVSASGKAEKAISLILGKDCYGENG